MRWHQTVGECLHGILKDGFISPEPADVIPPELPVVWFTSAQNWETSSNKGWRFHEGIWRRLTTQECELVCGGLFRIGVSDTFPLERFAEITRASNQSQETITAQVEMARAAGCDPDSSWFGTLEQVPLADCEVIEILTPEGWREVTQEDLDELERFMNQ
jgi:hypothetical protein